MEDPARLSSEGPSSWPAAWRRGVGLTLVVGLTVAMGLVPPPAGANPEVAAALRRLGAPGTLWGRLTVEEESPEGAWTPLSGVDVTIYPATSRLVTELEQIRQSARGSATQHESAVARIQAALGAHQADVDAEQVSAGPLRPEARPPGVSGTAPAPSPSAAGAPEKAPRSTLRREVTDPAGLFVFEDLPSGDWLVVATRVTPYGVVRLRPDPKPRPQVQSRRFLARAGGPTKEAELWVTRVRVEPGGRAALLLTDRARWLVGPTR